MAEELYHVQCPASGEKLTAEKTWVGKVGGLSVRYGTFKKHHHRGMECEWSGLTARTEEQPKAASVRMATVTALTPAYWRKQLMDDYLDSNVLWGSD